MSVDFTCPLHTNYYGWYWWEFWRAVGIGWTEREEGKPISGLKFSLIAEVATHPPSSPSSTFSCSSATLPDGQLVPLLLVWETFHQPLWLRQAPPNSHWGKAVRLLPVLVSYWRSIQPFQACTPPPQPAAATVTASASTATTTVANQWFDWC